MAPRGQPPDVPNAFVDRSADLITITEADGSARYTPPSLFRLYANHDADLRTGRVNRPRPGGYDDFAARWNQDPNCPYRFSTFDSASGAVTTVGAPFPAGFLDLIDPPPAPRAPSPPAVFEFSADQNELIQQMLWRTARRESFFERKREAARAKKVDDRRSRREEYRARDAAMGRPRTPQKGVAVNPAAVTGVIPIACGGGGARVAHVASAGAAASDNSAASSIVIAGSPSVAGPSTVPTLPIQATPASGSSVDAPPPPLPAPRAPSPMQEDGPELLATPSPSNGGNGASIFTDDDLIDFADDEDGSVLVNMKGKGKETA